MLSTPNTAPVGSPRELVNGGSAKNARYRYDEPSTRTRSGRVLMVSARCGRARLLLVFVCRVLGDWRGHLGCWIGGAWGRVGCRRRVRRVVLRRRRRGRGGLRRRLRGTRHDPRGVIGHVQRPFLAA